LADISVVSTLYVCHLKRIPNEKGTEVSTITLLFILAFSQAHFSVGYAEWDYKVQWSISL